MRAALRVYSSLFWSMIIVPIGMIIYGIGMRKQIRHEQRQLDKKKSHKQQWISETSFANKKSLNSTNSDANDDSEKF